jgi:hypothetical protein
VRNVPIDRPDLALCRGADEPRLLGAALAWRAHAQPYFGGSALFAVGSRLTHTCGHANTLCAPTSPHHSHRQNHGGRRGN